METRSHFEADVLNDLYARGHTDVTYEEDTIPYHAKPQKYTPDLRLPNGVYVEIKGRFTTHDRQKHLRIKEQAPEHDIRFVFMYDNKLYKGAKSTYSQWCEAHGFKWAMKRVPEEWLNESTN